MKLIMPFLLLSVFYLYPVMSTSQLSAPVKSLNQVSQQLTDVVNQVADAATPQRTNNLVRF